MFAKNKTDLINKLKSLQGKAIFKLTRTDSFNNGEFIKVLHKVTLDKIILIDNNMQQGSLYFPKANEIEYIENGFKIKNCTLELIKVF